MYKEISLLQFSYAIHQSMQLTLTLTIAEAELKFSNKLSKEILPFRFIYLNSTGKVHTNVYKDV